MSAAPHLQLVTDDRNDIEVSTILVRRFLDIPDDEPVEITVFYEGRVHIAHATTVDAHIRLLGEAQRRRDYTAAFMLCNGPMDPALVDRYEPDQIHRAWNGRVTDKDIATRRALFIDVDAIRPKGISSTDDQLQEAYEVSAALEAWLAAEVGEHAIGHGCSGNGFFTLIALEAKPDGKDTPIKVGAFLQLLNKMFGTDRVKIDSSVSNLARLMPAPGTWKRKGRNTEERPHRMTSFIFRAPVARIPREALIG